VQLALPGSVTDARVNDISVSGVRCVTDREFPIMTQVGLVLMLPAATGDPRRITCQGAVVRSDAGRTVGDGAEYDTAIFFTSMGDSDRAELGDFVELLTRSEPEQRAE
jgi:hypothetical protein